MLAHAHRHPGPLPRRRRPHAERSSGSCCGAHHTSRISPSPASLPRNLRPVQPASTGVILFETELDFSPLDRANHSYQTPLDADASPRTPEERGESASRALDGCLRIVQEGPPNQRGCFRSLRVGIGVAVCVKVSMLTLTHALSKSAPEIERKQPRCRTRRGASRSLVDCRQRRVSMAGRARHGGVESEGDDDERVAPFALT